MIGFCPLGSGSKGNSIYFGSKEAKILIDAGLSGKNIKERLSQINVRLQDIDAILITHEHTDHILGLKVLALQMGIPVFANAETAKGIIETFKECPKFKIFSTGERFEFRDIEFNPFSIAHDTLDPVAFTLHTDGQKFGFCADIGHVSAQVKHNLQGCNYLYIEANHQPSMVHASSRPMIYKRRVLGRTGHLSNEDCGQLLQEIAHAQLKHVHLAHLSEECNSPDVALSVIREILAKQGIELELTVAHQHQISKAVWF